MVHKRKGKDKIVVIYEEERIVGHDEDKRGDIVPIKETKVVEQEFNSMNEIRKFNEFWGISQAEEGLGFRIVTMFDKKTKKRFSLDYLRD